MHSKMMEGLVGAGVNMNMLEVPMRIYREAERRGDLGAMERAGNYITEFAGRKDEYREEVEEGAELEREERKEEEKEEFEAKRKQGTPDEAASLAISREGREAWERAAEGTETGQTSAENQRRNEVKHEN